MLQHGFLRFISRFKDGDKLLTKLYKKSSVARQS